MTEVQLQAVEQIKKIAEEHFEASLHVFNYTIENKNGPEESEDTRVTWHGGYAIALGLVDIARRQVRKSGNPPED